MRVVLPEKEGAKKTVVVAVSGSGVKIDQSEGRGGSLAAAALCVSSVLISIFLFLDIWESLLTVEGSSLPSPVRRTSETEGTRDGVLFLLAPPVDSPGFLL